ncbi:MAG: prepilin peptidase [Planctomycetota bacterium]
MFAILLLYLVNLFILGAMVGSFLNVCVYRLPRECMTLQHPKRSHCQSCYTQLTYFPDNIPILSWFLLRGRCRHCGAPFSFRYPAIEIVTAILFAFIGFRIDPHLLEDYFFLQQSFFSIEVRFLYLLYVLAFCSALVVVTLIDWSPLRIIPDEITIGGALLCPIAAYFCPMMFEKEVATLSAITDPALGRFLLSVQGAFVGFMALFLVSFFGSFFLQGHSLSPQEAMGFGDVKLMAFLGAFLGWKGALILLFIGSLLGAIVGILNWLISGKNTIPFGPYLSAGALMVLFQPNLLEWVNAWINPLSPALH